MMANVLLEDTEEFLSDQYGAFDYGIYNDDYAKAFWERHGISFCGIDYVKDENGEQVSI
jgi:hypothetical protein